jgi:hypothetical protein
MINIATYLYFSFDAGKPLEQLTQDERLFIQDVSYRHKDSTILMTIPLFETVNKLMGLEPRLELDHPSKESSLNWGYSQTVIVSFIFCDYRRSVKYSRPCFKEHPYDGFDLATVYGFIGMANIALYKQTGKRYLGMRTLARRCEKKIKHVCKFAPEYCLGKLSLLQAEISSLSRMRHHNTVLKYLTAIAVADSSKHLLEGALAHERYGRYLTDYGDLSSSLTHLRMACSLYREWNAYAKADMLQDEIDKMAGAPCSLPHPS